jgi:hypothetical protein
MYEGLSLDKARRVVTRPASAAAVMHRGGRGVLRFACMSNHSSGLYTLIYTKELIMDTGQRTDEQKKERTLTNKQKTSSEGV